VGVRLLLAAGAAMVLVGTTAAAPRSTTRFDGIRDCERAGAVQFKRHDATFKRFSINRAEVHVDKFADQVGQSFVATIYHGKASYEAAHGPRNTRFICLHGGINRGVLFVYTLPE
jgi:hypothetical protein